MECGVGPGAEEEGEVHSAEPQDNLEQVKQSSNLLRLEERVWLSDTEKFTGSRRQEISCL